MAAFDYRTTESVTWASVIAALYQAATDCWFYPNEPHRDECPICKINRGEATHLGAIKERGQ